MTIETAAAIFLVVMPALTIAQGLPPKAEQIPHELKAHGDVRIDNYYWLRDIENPKVKKHLNAESRYYKSYFSAIDRKLKETLVEETKSKIEEDETSAAAIYGQYEYYSRMVKGKNYHRHFRKNIKSKIEELVLDENERAAGKAFFAVRSKIYSPDLNFIAWCFDYEGSGKCELEIQNLKTLSFKKLGITEVHWGDMTWSVDSQSLFYAVPNQAQRPSEIWKTSLQGRTKRVFSEPDEQFDVSSHITDDLKWVMLTSSSYDQTKHYYWDGSEFKEMIKNKPMVQMSLYHSDDSFFVLSNHVHKNYGIYRFDKAGTPFEQWKEVIAPQARSKITSMAAVGNHLVYALRSRGNDEIHHFNINDCKDSVIPFSDVIYAADFVVLGSPLTVHIEYSSPVTPPQVFALDLKSSKLMPIKITKSPTLDAKLYQTELKMVKARDGKDIPIHLVYKKSLRKGKPQPVYLYAYGSYGDTSPSDFSETLFSLLDRGFIYVNAHVRGCDAQGEDWYEDGKLMNKKNTFNDFVDVSDYLIKEKYTEPRLLGIHGLSAGGLLIGAVLNQKPENFGAAIAGVPFVDVLTTMLDPTIPLTTQEYLQWGNPEEPVAYEYMKSYSPYDNVRQVAYPAIYVQTGLSDQQVGYWEPTKWVQKLREYNQSQHPIIMKVNMGAGHSGASGRYARYEEDAEKYVFLIKQLTAGPKVQ
jgi:oligopeptidase B